MKRMTKVNWMTGDVELHGQPIAFQLFVLMLSAACFAFFVYMVRGDMLLLLCSRTICTHLFKSLIGKRWRIPQK